MWNRRTAEQRMSHIENATEVNKYCERTIAPTGGEKAGRAPELRGQCQGARCPAPPSRATAFPGTRAETHLLTPGTTFTGKSPSHPLFSRPKVLMDYTID